MRFKRILIIGYGQIAKRHSKILKSLIRNVKIKYLRSKTSKQKKNIIFIYNKKEVEEFSPDLIVIANPSSMHIRSSLTFLNLKIPFFIEKPISNEYELAKKFVNKCKLNKIKIFIGYNLLYSDSLNLIKKTLKNNFGKIYFIRVDTGYNLKYWRKNTNYKNTVSANKMLGGGVLLELSHELNYLEWLFGKIVNFDCYFTKLSDLNINVEDFADMRLFFKNNNQKDKIFANVSLDFIRNIKTRKMHIFGDVKTILWDATKGEVKLISLKNNKTKLIISNKEDINNSYINMWKKCLNLFEKSNNYESANNALKTLSIIEKMKKNK